MTDLQQEVLALFKRHISAALSTNDSEFIDDFAKQLAAMRTELPEPAAIDTPPEKGGT